MQVIKVFRAFVAFSISERTFDVSGWSEGLAQALNGDIFIFRRARLRRRDVPCTTLSENGDRGLGRKERGAITGEWILTRGIYNFYQTDLQSSF
jgi:hypothetical protein